MIIELKRVSAKSVEIYKDAVDVCNCYINPSKTRGCGYMYFSDEPGKDNPMSMIEDVSENSWNRAYPAFGDRIYISGKSRLPRELVRRSYKISLSPDNAVCTVIPRVREFQHTTAWIILMQSNGDVTLVDVSNRKRFDSLNDNDIERAVESVMSGMPDGTKVLRKGTGSVRVWMLPKVAEYVEILSSGNRRYVSDNLLPLKTDNKVNVATLELWRRLARDNFNMFEKSLINSDAKDYPLTLCVFIGNEVNWSRLSDVGRKFLESINVDYCFDTFKWRNRRISDEDWNLLQEWIMLNLGVGKDGGFVKNRSRYTSMMFLVKSEVAVAPIIIDSPTTLGKMIPKYY